MFPPNCCRWPLAPVSFFRLRPSFIAPSSYPLYFYPASLVISLQNSIAGCPSCQGPLTLAAVKSSSPKYRRVYFPHPPCPFWPPIPWAEK
ncbi:hypothetical protein F3D69_22975 [Bacteroides ovatus]|uniref:Uncharacterized protein n=6 Tax=Bacteroidaceae TaxID=815 RepID=A0A6I0ZFE5_PHOVU|nr:hypothetical protein HMPREF0619_02066 [Parabacteroides sp. D13]KAA3949942.1 hypothetical protein F3D71_15640 [Bacteroides ovatus]KAB4109207.1 hypothetical protein GAQ70_11780 [Bacteroides uniformis]KAB6099658.1 hypothetical protein GA402_14990 [Bacteroides xylanisolvens]KAB6453758.1 hypothetical protein GAZ09_08500 [Phocaeicola vulgatus]RHH86037.1 hypothetical protein DW190_18745 [Bacteroides caccae]TWV69733.1 hypothetical protein FSA08_18370 [Bacteroides fragilis]DAM18392.1 MAG TPA: PriA